MDPKLIKDITIRVEQVKREEADETVLSAYLDAIAEVYETDRSTVESIARDVINKKGASSYALDWIKIRNITWVLALVLVMLSVIWLLYSSMQAFKSSESSSGSKDNQRAVKYVKEALSSLNIVKIYVAEHFQTMGSMPSSFAEMGIKESDLVATQYIDRLVMTDGGLIIVSLGELIGSQYFLKLKPVMDIANHAIEWDCRSNLALTVLDELDHCTPDIQGLP